jgi:anti-sigma-K factor RskA
VERVTLTVGVPFEHPRMPRRPARNAKTRDADDAAYRAYVIGKLRRSERTVAERGVLSHAEVVRRMAKYLSHG